MPRRAGRDVIDLGFGNPDIASPDVAVEKLAEAVRNPRNHRYSASRGIPKLRQAISSLYLRRFGVEIDPDTEAVVTIGAKEGLSHLMWVLLGPGDSALVPSPSYPIHLYAPAVRRSGGPPGPPRRSRPRRRAVPLTRSSTTWWSRGSRHGPSRGSSSLSFPHNPTTSCVDLPWMKRIVDFAREHDVVLVHDFAYADIAFDGYRPPSILEVPGAKDCAVELYTLTKSFSMAGWRVGFLVGNSEVVQALTKMKSYLDYGTFQPIQIAAIVAMNEAPDFPKVVNDIYQGAPRRALRRSQPDRVERHKAEGDDVRVGAHTRALHRDGVARVLCVPGRVRRGGDVTRGRVRSRRRRACPVRPHRERAADRAGRKEPAAGAYEAVAPHQHAVNRCGTSMTLRAEALSSAVGDSTPSRQNGNGRIARFVRPAVPGRGPEPELAAGSHPRWRAR